MIIRKLKKSILIPLYTVAVIVFLQPISNGYPSLTAPKPQLLNALFEHYLWLETNFKNGKKALLRGYQIENITFINTLSFIEFHNCTFNDINFRGIDLSDTSFFDCRFIQCRFEGSNLKRSHIFDCIFEYADFNSASLNDTQLINTEINHSNFHSASFLDSIFHGTVINNSSLRNSVFVPRIFDNCKLINSDMTNCSFRYKPKFGKKRIAKFISYDEDTRHDDSFDFEFMGSKFLENLYRLYSKFKKIYKVENHYSKQGVDWGSEFTGTQFTNVNFSDVVMNVSAKSNLAWYGFADSDGLENLEISGSRVPFFKLKSEMQAHGLRTAPRQLSCAILRAEVKSDQFSMPISFLSWVAFDFTCRYGADFRRPILLFLCSVIFGCVNILIVSSVAIFKNERVLTVHESDFYISRKEVFFSKNKPLRSVCMAFMASIIAHSRYLGIGDISIKTAIIGLQGSFDDVVQEGRVLKSLSGLQAIVGVYLAMLTLFSYALTPFG